MGDPTTSLKVNVTFLWSFNQAVFKRQLRPSYSLMLTTFTFLPITSDLQPRTDQSKLNKISITSAQKNFLLQFHLLYSTALVQNSADSKDTSQKLSSQGRQRGTDFVPEPVSPVARIFIVRRVVDQDAHSVDPGQRPCGLHHVGSGRAHNGLLPLNVLPWLPHRFQDTNCQGGRQTRTRLQVICTLRRLISWDQWSYIGPSFTCLWIDCWLRYYVAGSEVKYMYYKSKIAQSGQMMGCEILAPYGKWNGNTYPLEVP